MKKQLDFLFIGLVFLLGGFHTVMTLLFRRPVDLDFWMYVGTGLVFLLSAGLNLPAIRSASKPVMIYCLLVNCLLILLLFFIMLEMADARSLIVISAYFGLLASTLVDLKHCNHD